LIVVLLFGDRLIGQPAGSVVVALGDIQP